jgi:hypothetical protein
MSKYRLIQVITHNKKGEYNEKYKIQKNYGKIIPDWIELTNEEYENKNEALNRLEEIKKDKTTKYLSKTIKVIK